MVAVEVECFSELSFHDRREAVLGMRCDEFVERLRGIVADDPEHIIHSLDFRSVLWGKTKFTFTEMQAACVKVLWENWKQKTPDVADKTLLDAVEGYQSRLDHVFNKGQHPAWKTMIVGGGTRGTHRLADPESAGT